MLVTRTEIVDVPNAVNTVLQIRETSSYQRTLYFENRDDSATISVVIQKSTDGSTWTNVGVSFDLSPAGGGTEIATKNVTDTNQLRIRASGGADDQELSVGCVTYYSDTAPIVWVSPII